MENNIFRVEFGTFRLDGGSMFGSVPKNLWSKLIPVDEENCIPLSARGIMIVQGDKKILVDVGMGEKWDEKSRKIFEINNKSFAELNLNPEEVTDVILTHLHFDHAGGISKFGKDNTEVIPVYPNAKVHIQKHNLEIAKSPSLREKASYLKENWQVVTGMECNLLEGDTQIFAGITGHEISGHTEGQQWIEVKSKNQIFMFATDLIPTSRHLPLPYVMGYDLCARKTLEEKQVFLDYAIKNDATIIFQHDPDLPAAKIHINQKGHYAVKETVFIPEWDG